MVMPPGGVPRGSAAAAPPLTRITINGTEYPCSEWQEIERGESIERIWTEGFYEGIGESRVKSPHKCLYAHFMDLTSPPYVRLIPSITQVASVTGLDTAYPVYSFRAQQPDGINVIYFLNGSKRFKVNRDTSTLMEIITVANVIYGRPALFNGSWRLARGASVVAVTITINSYPTLDVVTGIGAYNARHFACIQDEGTAKLAMASSTNQVSLSSDAITFATGFSVGDTSFGISDLLESQGELLVIRPDGPYRFNAKGDSLALQKYIGAHLLASVYDGSNSHGHGPYAYWVTTSGIWRIAGDAMIPMGFEADPQYFATLSTDIDLTAWLSVVAFGRWLYASRGSQVWQGFIHEDGLVTWYGAIFDSAPPTTCKVQIDDGPVLWIATSGVGNPLIRRINLQPDGSIRGFLGSASGADGASGVTGTLQLGTDDFGRPDRTKQMRRFWVITEGASSPWGTLTLQVERDGGSVESVGNTITAAGFTERTWTVGTNDTFREARFSLKLAIAVSCLDSRIRAFGYEAHTPSIYQAKIPLTEDSVRGYALGIQGSLQNLRALQNAQLVAVKEPQLDATRNGYILASRANVSWFHPGERAVGVEGGTGIGYEVIVTIEFFDIPASVA